MWADGGGEGLESDTPQSLDVWIANIIRFGRLRAIQGRGRLPNGPVGQGWGSKRSVLVRRL